MLYGLAYTKDQFKPYRPHTDLQKTAENPYRPKYNSDLPDSCISEAFGHYSRAVCSQECMYGS